MSTLRVGVTGSEGLIGSALVPLLSARGWQVERFDLQMTPPRDVSDPLALEEWVERLDGIVHLAAVSRVIWGERDPAARTKTNVGGTRNVLVAATRAQRRPWVVVASSREVYGEPRILPVDEEAAIAPVNVYGRSKATAEQLALGARADGLRTLVLRLSNVYGSTADHADRVIPAFARAAAEGGCLRLDGADHTFDFTHVSDVARGIATACEVLAIGSPQLPPIQLVTGHATTLAQLAAMAVACGHPRARVVEAPPRHYDVTRFVGSPRRAEALLGWHATRSIADGLRTLVADFARN